MQYHIMQNLNSISCKNRIFSHKKILVVSNKNKNIFKTAKDTYLYKVGTGTPTFALASAFKFSANFFLLISFYCVPCV